jgi:hypothetical protein
MKKHTHLLGALLIPILLLLPRGATAQAVELEPNLTPFAASDLSIVSGANGPELRFTTTTWNRGVGPMELIPGDVDSTRTKQKVYQRVYRSDGTSFDNLAGTMTYHEQHAHFHLDGYATYTLQPVNAPGGSARTSQKTSFCLLDSLLVDGSLPGAPGQRVYSSCTPAIQGISVGWGDRYGWTLQGQSFNLTGEPDGDYQLFIDVDPQNQLIESNNDDNRSCLLVRLRISQGIAESLGECGNASSAVSVLSISPASISAGGSANVTITGSGFAEGMSVSFENGSGPAPVASSVTVVDDQTITATVSVRSGGGKRVRRWDVRVSSAVLPGAFTVTP